MVCRHSHRGDRDDGLPTEVTTGVTMVTMIPEEVEADRRMAPEPTELEDDEEMMMRLGIGPSSNTSRPSSHGRLP